MKSAFEKKRDRERYLRQTRTHCKRGGKHVFWWRPSPPDYIARARQLGAIGRGPVDLIGRCHKCGLEKRTPLFRSWY